MFLTITLQIFWFDLDSRNKVFTIRIPGEYVLSPGLENEDHRVHQHPPGEQEELRGLFSEHLGLGHHDDDDLAEGDGEEPGGLHHGLHGDRGLAVGELHASHGEHDLADGDDDVLGELPEHVDSVGRGEREEGC